MAMNNIERDYLKLLYDVFKNGELKEGRNGKTRSVFGRQIRHDMKLGFPLLTTKKMYWKGIVTELLWFLRGDTNIKFLVDNGCHIWDGDAFKNYISKTNEFKGDWPDTMEEFINKIKTDDEFAKEWGELGPVYGAQWRKWDGIDQIENLIHDLKTNPDSRRMMVSAWNVNYLDEMVLPPCHYGFQVYTRELSLDERLRLVNYDKEKFNSIDEWITWYNNEPNEFYYMGINYTKDTALTDLGVPTRAISLMWNQRSADVLLGLPFNIASYGLLLEIIAKAVNMVPDELIGNLGDVHLYSNHIKQAKEQLTREPMKLPKLKLGEGPMEIVDWQKTDLDTLLENMSIHRDTCFQLENYQSHPTIKAPLSN